MRVRDLTLRTPTLDDVFLELTGTHIETEHDRPRSTDRRPSTDVVAPIAATDASAPDRPVSCTTWRPSPAARCGRCRATSKRRAARVHRVFFFIVNIGTLQNLTQSTSGLRLHRVPDGDRGAARGHRRVAGAGARARRAERLPRPAPDDALRRMRDPARPHGRRRHRGGGADACRSSASGSRSACASRPARSAWSISS